MHCSVQVFMHVLVSLCALGCLCACEQHSVHVTLCVHTRVSLHALGGVCACSCWGTRGHVCTAVCSVATWCPHVYARRCARVQIHVHAGMCTYTFTCAGVCSCASACVSTFACVYCACLHTCMCVHRGLYMSIFVCALRCGAVHELVGAHWCTGTCLRAQGGMQRHIHVCMGIPPCV